MPAPKSFNVRKYFKLSATVQGTEYQNPQSFFSDFPPYDTEIVADDQVIQELGESFCDFMDGDFDVNEDGTSTISCYLMVEANIDAVSAVEAESIFEDWGVDLVLEDTENNKKLIEEYSLNLEETTSMGIESYPTNVDEDDDLPDDDDDSDDDRDDSDETEDLYF